MAELTTESVINDNRWSFVESLLPDYRDDGRYRIDPRSAFAAVVYVVTADAAWANLPRAFGVTASTAQDRFWRWTFAHTWRDIKSAAIGTPHSHWARSITGAAIDRASRRAYGCADPSLGNLLRAYDPVGELTEPYPRYSRREFAVARAAMNRPVG